MCVRDNLAAIRSQVKPKYGARMDSGEIEKKFVSYYINKFSGNHTPGSVLTEKEKTSIFNTVTNLVT